MEDGQSTDRDKKSKECNDAGQGETEEEQAAGGSGDAPTAPPEEDRRTEDYYDQLLRTQAEFENYKKRTEKEVAGFKAFANAQLIKDLLGVMDDLKNALDSTDPGNGEQFRKGIELIYRNLHEVLQKEGLAEIDPKDECFDPWKHEAVEMVPTDEVPEHTIMGVVQRGYKLKDKVLRTAKVRVAVEPKVEKEDKVPTDEADEEEPEDSE